MTGLETTVEFFNLVVSLKLKEQEKRDLVAFMRQRIGELMAARRTSVYEKKDRPSKFVRNTPMSGMGPVAHASV